MNISVAHGAAKVLRMPGQGWYLMSLVVEPEFRGRGIGTRLMEKILAGSGRPIYLLVSGEFGSDVERLKEFYSRFGFIPYRPTKSNPLPYNANMILN